MIKLFGGLTYLLIAGDLLVRGALSLSRQARIPPMIVGLTVVAFGTSAPELFVSVGAANATTRLVRLDGSGDFTAIQPALDASAAGKLVASLYRAFMAHDASLAEINPLIETTDGRVLALDAKMNFDDNALYRHKEILELRDVSEEGRYARNLTFAQFIKGLGSIAGPAVAIALALVGLVTAGCSRSVDREIPRVIILGLDGMDHELTTRLMAEGRLPALARTLVAWLAEVPGNCIVYFPAYRYLPASISSTTSPNLAKSWLPST